MVSSLGAIPFFCGNMPNHVEFGTKTATETNKQKLILQINDKIYFGKHAMVNKKQAYNSQRKKIHP